MPSENPENSLNLLYSVSKELSASLNLSIVLERVLELCIRNVNAERGSIVALDDNQKPIDSVMVINQKTINYTAHDVQGVLDHGLAGWVLRHQQPVLVSDTTQDTRWFRRPDDAVSRTGAKSAICIPMILAGDQIVGILTIVHPQPNFLKESHLALLQAISDQAALTIHNANLYQSLQSVKQRYQKLFDENIDPILVSDWKGRIIEANQSALSLFSNLPVDILMDKSIYDLHSVDWEWLSSRSESLHNNETLTYLSEIEQNDRHTPVEVHIHKINIGDAEYLQWIIHDISERKNLEKLRDELSAMIYHDLRSPLSNVLSSLEMLDVVLPEDTSESAHQLAQIAMRSTRRVQRLISSLLDINRLENGQTITQQHMCNLENIVHEAFEAVQVNAESKDIHLNNDIPADFPELWIDHDMIKRVVINLLENAIKFTPVDGNIHIGARFENNEATLWVEDDGPGIPLEAQQFIFDKYVHLNKEKYPKGIGLGLAFCRMAVQAHGGQIWVESDQKAGSRFIFTLPASRPE
ncbi:MAG: ATP-binding protein [Anaerolineae bacterium]|nr:ATP-binding protein [Anaerolineae bacterium]